jgi:HEPN domain-containing protein
MKMMTREWVRKAEADYVIAVQSSRSKIPLHDGVCFHCQQCVEKYLKGLLEELGRSVPKTHNLDDVLNLLQPDFPTLDSFRRPLIILTNYAVVTRYPGENASKRQAGSALGWLEKIRAEARHLLGIRPPRKRR